MVGILDRFADGQLGGELVAGGTCLLVVGLPGSRWGWLWWRVG